MASLAFICQGLKAIVSSASLIGGVYSMVSRSSPYLIGGIMLITAGIGILDTYSVNRYFDQLHHLNEEYANLNKRLQDEVVELVGSNEQLKDNLHQFDEKIGQLQDENKTLEEQIIKLKLVQENANKLLRSLIDAENSAQDISNTLKNNLDRLDNTAEMLEMLVKELKKTKFEEIDTNHDNIITPDEMQAWLMRK